MHRDIAKLTLRLKDYNVATNPALEISKVINSFQVKILIQAVAGDHYQATPYKLKSTVNMRVFFIEL